jgi:hypothetical protein
MHSGRILVKIKEANFHKDKDFIGKLDPYVIVRLGTTERKT